MIFGCDEASWDSMVHHYYSFYWVDMIDLGLKHCLTDLGYTQTSWDTGLNPPRAESLYWRELNDAEKQGAICLGYKPSTWDVETDCFEIAVRF